MKNSLKLIIITLIVVLLAGCGKVATMKNGEEKIAGTSDEEFSVNQLYDSMLEKYGAEAFISMLDTSIYNKMYKETDDEKEYLKSQIKDMKDSAKQNNMTYNEVIEYYGFTDEDSMKDYLRLNYRRDKAVNNYISKDISDDEVKSYYKSNIYGDIKARHILIKVETQDSDSDKEKAKKDSVAKKKAEDLIEQLNDGADFSELAKKNSEDEATAKKGGDLGFYSYGDMVAEFDKAAFALKKGEYTDTPVKTTYGYHIIIKDDEKAKPSLKSSRSKILETLVKNKLNSDPSLYYTTLDNIREDAGLKFEDDKVKKLYNSYMDDMKAKAKANAEKSSQS